MGKHTFRLTQSGSAVWDFQNASNNVISMWNMGQYERDKAFVEDTLTVHPTGSTLTNFLDNLKTFGRVIQDGDENWFQFKDGFPYTPIFLQFAQDGQSYTLQSEFFGGNPQAVANYIDAGLRANVLHDLPLTLRRRPYWEETAEQTLASGVTISNDGGYTDISGVRGDLPAPLTIQVRTATTNQDRIIVGFKARGTVTNFVNKYEAEGYTTRGTGVANLSSATEPNFSPGSSTVGQRWTPASTSETTILTWDITSNVSDQLGTYRVFVRWRDNRTAGFNVKIRVRAGVYTGSNDPQYGDYGDIAKYGDGTGTSGGSNSSPGTTSVSLTDCGIISLPPVDMQGMAPTKMIIELAATAETTSGSPTADFDYLLLVPLYELPLHRGYGMASYPIALGNGTTPDAILTARDRSPRAYLDASGTIQYGASEIRGNPLFAKPNTTIRVFVMTQRTSNLRHTYNLSNTVTISSLARYRYPGRGT